MQRVFDSLTKRLQGFVEQKNDIVLVVSCRDMETAYILKSLQSIDQGDSPDVFWMFGGEFEGAAPYASLVAEHFRVQHEAVCVALEKEGSPPLPPIPPEVFDPALPPAQRMRRLMVFARSLLADVKFQIMVWALIPFHIARPREYADFVAELSLAEFPAPWCHHMRLIARETSESPSLRQVLGQRPRIDWYEPDLSQKAMEKGMEDDVQDPKKPLPQRLQSLFVLANIDFANRRHADALKKHELLLDYYQTTENHTMSAVVLNSMGENHYHMGDKDRAEALFLSALTPGLESKAHPVLLNIVVNLGNLKVERRQWQDAELYWDSAEKLATQNLVHQVKIQALENLGICRCEQGKADDGVRDWEAGATLARNTEEKDMLRRILQRLQKHYASKGPQSKKQEAEKELAAL